MQLSHPRFHLGVFGGSGTGKTTYALKFVAASSARCVFLFDAEGEFSGRMKLAPARTPAQVDAGIRSGWLCYDPHEMFSGDMESAIAYFSRLALEAAKRIPGRKFIVIDELGWYVSGNNVPFPLKQVVQSGRRFGLDGVFIGQQPNELHNTIRTQLTEVVCFQLTDDTALEFPRKFGFDVEAVRSLAPHRFICRNNRGGEWRG